MAADSRFDSIPLDESKGQVWTPDGIGKRMVDLIGDQFDFPISILDPASGPGTFMTLVSESKVQVESFTGVEIDPLLHEVASRQALECRFPSTLINADFFADSLSLQLFDAVIVNPPYIRHEKLEAGLKNQLVTHFSEVACQKLSRQTNLYGYFLLKSLEFIKPGGVLCAIIYDSLRATRYGKLLENALWKLGEISFRETVDSPFSNRLINAEIILIKKRAHVNTETESEGKRRIDTTIPNGYCDLRELARVVRGTSFAKRSHYVFDRPNNSVSLSPLITKHKRAESLKARSNSFAILKTGNQRDDSALMRVLNSHHQLGGETRGPKLPTPVSGGILFNYYIRTNVRHLINESRIPASDNYYCVEPLDALDLRIHWFLANSMQYVDLLLKASRPQGSGLRKLQLYEYWSVPFPNYKLFSESATASISREASKAISADWTVETVREKSSEMLGNILS